VVPLLEVEEEDTHNKLNNLLIPINQLKSELLPSYSLPAWQEMTNNNLNNLSTHNKLNHNNLPTVKHHSEASLLEELIRWQISSRG
jgi:hypothetical protein